MWELALLIATVVGAVHFVHRYAFKQGITMGIMVGRKEILEENIQRTLIMSRDNRDIYTLVNQLVENELPKVKYEPREESNGIY